jgi:hypothetical protein
MRQVSKKGILTAVATGTVLASTAGGYAFAGAGAEGAAVGSPGVASGNTVQVPVTVPVNVCGDTIDVVGLLNPAFGNNCANTSTTVHQPSGGGVQGGGNSTGGSNTGGSSTGGSTSGGSNTGGSHTGGGSQNGPGAQNGPGGGGSVAGSSASGVAQGSPGVLSGNTAQVPVHVPVNACGDSVDVIALLNPAFGNTCVNSTSSTGVQAPPVTPGPGTTPGGSVTPSTPPSVPGTPSGGHQVVPSVPVTRVEAASGSAPAAARLAYTGVDGLDVMVPAGLGLLLAGGLLYRRSRRAA